MTSRPRPDLMTHDEVAALLGIDPESVRSTCRRAEIAVVHGYPRELVEALDRRRRRTCRPGHCRHLDDSRDPTPNTERYGG